VTESGWHRPRRESTVEADAPRQPRRLGRARQLESRAINELLSEPLRLGQLRHPAHGDQDPHHVHARRRRRGIGVPPDKASKRCACSPHWTLFISVEDTDRALSRAAASGATILRGPFLVADVAEVTAIRDPTGAIISLWQPLKFYRDVFGWPLRSLLNGRTFVATSQGVGVSIREPNRHDRTLPEGWLPYFLVHEVDRASAQAEALGATAIG
jgi:predicted enzyme related to lactoylglutathione lyase